MRIKELHLHWRPSKYKNKIYKSYSLAKAYRVNGKNRREVFLSLGKLSDEEATQCRTFLKAIKNPEVLLTTFEDITISKKYSYLDLAVLKEIWNEWELDKPFERESNSSIKLSLIALILTMNKSLKPLSKFQACSWIQKTWLPQMYNFSPEHINPSRIFRELGYIEDCKKNLCNHLYKSLKSAFPASMSKVFYDLSSTTFSGAKCILMKWGHCKEGYLNHVVLALLVNQDGLPFYWDVLEGNTTDSNTITWLLEKLKRMFPELNTTLVFDRGMVSDSNLSQIESSEYKYISAMDKNQIEKITHIDFSKYSFFEENKIEKQMNDLAEFTKLNETTYYQEVGIINNRRFILCFNPQLFKDQRKGRKMRMLTFIEYVKKLNNDLASAQKSRDQKVTHKKFDKQISKLKLNGYTSVSLKKIIIKTVSKKGDKKSIVSYQGLINPVNDKQRIEVEKLDGFWLLVTNHIEKEGMNYKLISEKAINPYREKVVIESSFRDIKSFIKISPVYVWTVKHVKAHFTICVLSHFLNRILTMKLHTNPGKMTKEIITHEKLYELLSDYEVNKIHIKNMDVGGYKLTLLDNKAKEVIERLGLTKILKYNKTITNYKD